MMPIRIAVLSVFAFLFALAPPVSATPGDWVTVVLDDGREFYGRVLEEEEHRIVIEYRVGGIATSMTFGANQIDEIRRESTATDEEMDKAMRALDLGVPAGAPAEPEAEQGGYAIVPAEGVIGHELSVNFFQTVLDRAVETGAEAVIFHLESPGGYVHILERIRDTIDEYDDDLEIGFYVNDDAFSAAAMLCMSAEHFYVGPGAAFGAAVMWEDRGSGPTAVESKFASASAAKWRTFAEKAGRPGILMDAMMIQDTEVWADKSQTPWILSRSRPDGPRKEGADIELIDSRVGVLSITHSNAIEIGAADGSIESPEAMIEHLGIDHPDRVAFDGEDLARVILRAQASQVRQIESRLRAASETVERLTQGNRDSHLTVSTFRREVRRLRSQLQQLRKRYVELDYAQLYLATEYGWSLEWLDDLIDQLTAIDTSLR